MHMGESEAELVERTKEFAESLPAHAWVVTQGWRDYRWETARRRPPGAPSTKAFPDRPCVMYSGDGHTLWLNSRALDELGVTRDSVPPQGGSYDKDEDGELTGIVREAAAMELLPRCLAWLTEEDIARAYADQMGRMAEQGITSVCDMALMLDPGRDFIRDDVYERLSHDGGLTLRVHMYPTLVDDQSRLEDLQERYAGDEFPLLRAPGFKQFFDGVSSQHTAWLTDPYANARFDGDSGLSHGARRPHARSWFSPLPSAGTRCASTLSATAPSTRRSTYSRRRAPGMASPYRGATRSSI